MWNWTREVTWVGLGGSGESEGRGPERGPEGLWATPSWAVPGGQR